jgi:uncharacterized protein (DUF58 family)
MASSLSERGWRLLISSFILLFLGVLLRDFVLGITGFVCLGLLGYSYYSVNKVVSNLGRFVKVEPNSFKAKFTAGQNWEEDVRVASSFDGELTLVSPVEGGSFSPQLVESGVGGSKFVFKPQLSGEYSVDKVGLIARDRWSLWSDVGRVSFSMSFQVNPRLYEVVFEALEYLGEGKRVGVGLQGSTLRGSGFEYADSRDYVPGDSPRMFDWKATARLGRLIVKDYYLEGEMGLHVVLEASAPDPVSRDELATEFLRTVLSFAQQNIPMGLTVGGSGGVEFYVESLPPQLAVAEALRASLRFADVDAGMLYEVLEPAMVSLLGRLLSTGVTSRDVSGLVESFSRIEAHLELVVVTALMDPVEVSELSRISRLKGWGMCVLQPTRPWDSSFGLEEGVDVYRRYLRLNRTMGKLVPIVSSADDVQGTIARSIHR